MLKQGMQMLPMLIKAFNEVADKIQAGEITNPIHRHGHQAGDGRRRLIHPVIRFSTSAAASRTMSWPLSSRASCSIIGRT